MISSMTGYGEATVEVDGIMYTVEIKTVNSRYMKIYVKVPDLAAFLSDEIEKLIKQMIHRGTINCSVSMQSTSDQPMFDLDENILNAYIGKLQQLAQATNVNGQIDLATLLTLPGTIKPFEPNPERADEVRKAILGAVTEAVEQLKEMRAEEGKRLADDMIDNCKTIQETLKLIEKRSTEMVQIYHDKLQKRVDDLLAGAQLQIDADILAREVAVFADRSDISEELIRLDSHLKQFKEFCRASKSSGRRLDFISQEMLREANTVASKGCDTQICQWVIDIKCAIDRIKEQVQNVE